MQTPSPLSLLIVDKRTKSVHIFELIVPGEARLVITLKKPYFVIVDKRTKSDHIFELTVPGEARLDTAHRLKANSYAHLVNDIQSHTLTVTPFEVGAHTGQLNIENLKKLQTMHSF